MDEKSMLDWVLRILWGISLTLTGWFHMRLNKVEERLTNHMVHTAGNYTPRDETRECFDKLDEKLDRILDKLEKKADK